MPKLAILGGKPLVGKTKKWAKWPISAESDAQLVARDHPFQPVVL